MKNDQLCRKDLARILGLSVFQIASNEARLGLLEAKKKVNGRVIVYDAKLAMDGMRAKGVLIE